MVDPKKKENDSDMNRLAVAATTKLFDNMKLEPVVQLILVENPPYVGEHSVATRDLASFEF